jgi:hypothetical protein
MQIYELNFTGEQLNEKFKNTLSGEEVIKLVNDTKKGASAYEIACEEGFSGTKTEWL